MYRTQQDKDHVIKTRKAYLDVLTAKEKELSKELRELRKLIKLEKNGLEFMANQPVKQ